MHVRRHDLYGAEWASVHDATDKIVAIDPRVSDQRAAEILIQEHAVPRQRAEAIVAAIPR